MKLATCKIRFLLMCTLMLSGMVAHGQYPIVYFNKLFKGTGSGYTLSQNSITVGTQIPGENFRFIGSNAGSSFTATGNNVYGSIIYTDATGNQVTLANGIAAGVGPSGNPKKYFNFIKQATDEAYIFVNPNYDADVVGSAAYQFNASSPLTDLNSFLSLQTVVTVTANLSGFSTCLATASAVQSFTLSGTNLSSNITVTAPAGFEVSLSASSGFGSSISVLKGAGTSIASTTIYTRLIATNTPGSYTGNLVISATNSANKNVYAFGDVYTAPSISAHPVSTSVCAGNATTFSVTASGGMLTYQWQRNTGSGWSNLTNAGIFYGVNTAVLRISNTVDASYNLNQFRCVVSGACTPAVTSNAATLTVNSAVSIQSQPSNVSVCANSATSFSVSSTGTGLAYQWQVYSSGSWSNITNGGIYSGATTSTLSLSTTSNSENNLKYQCVITGTCSNLTSASATLTVNNVPAAPTTILGDMTICENTNQSYAVNDISGATSYTWTLPAGWTGTSVLRAINISASTSGGYISVKANNSCGSSAIYQATIVVSNLPAPVVDFNVNTVTQCLSGNSFSFTNATTSGVSLSSTTWTFGDGASDLNSNSTHTYANANLYSVNLRVVASNGCISSKSKFVTVNAAPTSTISGTQTICSGSTAPLSLQLTGAQPWSVTYSDGSTTNTVSNISTSNYTLNVIPSSTKTFTISSITDANCSTTAIGDRIGSAIVTVNQSVTASVSVASNDADNSVCSGTVVVFTATPSNGGTPVYSWQKNGVDIGSTGSSYTVNSNTLLDDDVFSVQMASNATCVSNPVVFSNSITLHIAPGAPRTPTVISGATTQCALGVSKTYSIVDVLNATSYTWSVPTGWTITGGQGTIQASVTVGAANQIGDISVSATNGCGTSSAQVLTITAVNASPNAPTGSANQSFCLDASPTVASLTATGTSLKWYNSAGLTSQLSSSNSLSSSNYYVTQTASGCESPSLTVAVVVTTNPTISSTTPGNSCGTGTVTLSANPSAGTLNWYAASTGGTSLGSLTSFTTPSISVTTTYYVEAVSNACISATRTAVVATVIAVPTITATTPSAVCGTGTVTLGASASAGNLNWYDANTGGNLVASNANSFTTNTISSSTTFYVQAVNNGCTSVGRTAVVASVVNIPTIQSTTAAERCGSGSLTLAATSSSGSPKWYSASTGGTSLYTGASYSTSSILTTTTYYVQAEDQGCVSASRTAVMATIKAIPSITSVSNASRCGDGTLVLSASPSAGIINWYDVASGGIALGNTNSYTTQVLTSTTIYYAEATQNGCTSARSAVTATVTQLPITISGNATDYDLVSLTASGGNSYSWNGGNSPSGASNTFDESGSYTVTVSNNAGCTSTRTIAVQIKIVGLDRYGNAAEDSLVQVNRFGERAGNNPVVKFGGLKKYKKYKMQTQNLALYLNPADTRSYNGGLTWTDLSSNNNDGTLQNGLTFSTANGGTMAFDGINDFVSLNSLALTNSMTIDIWVKPDNISGTKSILCQNGSGNGIFQFQLNGAIPQFVLQGEQTKSANTSIIANNWTHLVIAFNQTSNSVKFFVNGNLVNNETFTNAPSITNSNVKIGTLDGVSNLFKGSMGSVRVYSAVLTDGQINANFQSTKDLYGL